MEAASCLRCGGSNESDDLVCLECSQTRVRAALPNHEQPSLSESDAPLFGDLVYDEQLDVAEGMAGEMAWGLVLRIREQMGGDTSLSVEAIMAPQGPATPAEDVWGAPVLLVHLHAAKREVITERIAWARHTTTVRHLHAVEIDERRILARPGFLGAPDALPLLLAARLRLASLAFERVKGAPVVSFVRRDGYRETLACEVHLAARDGRKQPVVVELFTCEGAPMLDPRLVLAAASFCETQKT